MTGFQMIYEERERQKTVEGYTHEHDDRHHQAELAKAAECYATPPENRVMRPAIAPPDSRLEGAVGEGRKAVPKDWPWEPEWWKPCPTDRVRELVKAGALFMAESERLDRRGLRSAAFVVARRAIDMAVLIDGMEREGSR